MRVLRLKWIAGLFLLTILLAGLPLSASAVSLEVTNPYSESIVVAVAYFNDNYSDWVCTGWYTVQANSTRTLSFKNSNQATYIYAYAKNSNATWDGSNTATNYDYTIVSNAFSYRLENGCPDGKNQRTVTFMGLPLYDNVGHLHL